MHISTASNHRDRYIRFVRDLWSRAKHFSMSQDEIIIEKNQYLYGDTAWSRVPRWVRAEVRGYYNACREFAYRYDLVFSYEINGKRLAIDTEEYKNTVNYQTLDINTGAYIWRKNGKIFFMSTNTDKAV